MNGYFRLIHEKDKTCIKLIPPTDGGKPLAVNDVTDYLALKDIIYDKNTLYKAIETLEDEEVTVLLEMRATLKERECYKFTISQDYMSAHVRFYAPSVGGEEMTAQELLKDLESKGIRHGIKQDAIIGYFKNREYCEDILVAEGTAPVQGKDAYIEYNFNTDRKAKPTLNDDGSVDFFHLNVVQHCHKGDVLAKLIPAVPGKYGMNLVGARLKPADVRNTTLKYGNNIDISEDKTVLTSAVNGHVELVDGTVFVSDVLVVENVDASTGNIECEGSVQVNGNVGTNFQVKAKGNIVVKGVVEGALLEAGDNVIIARGMNGMGRGAIKAGGNIISKFLENAAAEAKGYVAADSILHSLVEAGTEINVDGKRGFIIGGKVSAVNSVNVKTLGSSMGADTIIEVGTDPKLNARVQELQKLIEAENDALKQIYSILADAKTKIAKGIKLTPEQAQHIQKLANDSSIKTENINKYTQELENLSSQTKSRDGACVVVKESAYPGTTICIGDVSMRLQKEAQYCRFIKAQGDVKITGII
ncbi:MAG: DUF342 domain-containing protein [Lachnospiraceae bacterium]|nr:DUF342 domain-containing protein [Lachnospiraceae bacterium]